MIDAKPQLEPVVLVVWSAAIITLTNYFDAVFGKWGIAVTNSVAVLALVAANVYYWRRGEEDTPR